MLPYIHIGALSIHSYTLMLVVSGAATFLLAWQQRGTLGLSGVRCMLYQTLIVVCAFCAGKLLVVILNPVQAMEEGIASVGFNIFGAFFLGILMNPLIGRLFGLRPQPVLDLSAQCFTLFIGCQWIGCFMAGCCGGWKACVFGTCFRWPTQMIESIGDFLILALLLERRRQWEGRLYPIFLILHGTLHFFVEFLRDNDKNILLLSQWQWFALLAVLIGILWNRAAKENSNG